MPKLRFDISLIPIVILKLIRHITDLNWKGYIEICFTSKIRCGFEIREIRKDNSEMNLLNGP